MAEKARKRESWPTLDAPTGAEIKAIAELRGLSMEGVSLAAEAGLLWCANCDEGRAWIVTDSRRINAQARRMDGQPWAHIGSKRLGPYPEVKRSGRSDCEKLHRFRQSRLSKAGQIC